MATMLEAPRVSPAARPIPVPKRRHRFRMTAYALIVAVINWHVQQSSLPGIFTAVETPLIKRVVAWRLGLWDLSSLNTVKLATALTTPTLIFHGGADTNAPRAPSAQLAKTRPDIVTYFQVAGAEHTSSWNVNPSSYTARLRGFLTRVAL